MGNVAFLDGAIFSLNGETHHIVTRRDDGMYVIEDSEGDRFRKTEDELALLHDRGELQFPGFDAASPQLMYGLPAPDLRLLANDDESPDPILAEAEAREQVVEALLKMNHPTSRKPAADDVRRSILRKAGLRESTHLITLSKWCRRYHDAGIDGLKKRRRGPKDRRTRFYDEIAKRAIATHIIDLQREKLTAYEFFVTEAQAARDNENVKLAERGHKLLPKVPSYSWFLIRCNEEKARKKDEGAKGRRKVRQDYDVSVSGPKVRKLLERVEIDGKSVRVALREEPEKAKKFRRSDLLILGPFTLIAAVDCRSALPLGLCFTYDGEDIHSVLACFRHTMRPKAYLHDPEQASWWGCKHDWPARGRLSLVVYDRLKSGYSNSVRYALRRAGITIQRPPPYTPPGKSKVERFFEEFERFCKDYPGYMPDPEKWISEADPIANALFTSKEFIRDVHQWIVDEYSQKSQEELGNRSPYEAWKELSQLQRIRPYPNPNELDYLFSDHKKCTLNKDGIHINDLEYNSQKLQAIIDQHGPGCRVQVAFDKHDLGEVTVFDPATGKAYTHVRAKDYEFAKGLSLRRLKKIRGEIRKRGQSSNLAEFQRAKVRRLSEVDRIRKRGKNRTHIDVAREEGYSSATLSSSNASLDGFDRRPDAPAKERQGHEVVIPTDLPMWTDEELPDIESVDE
jgi:Mu transposase, C-terminal